MGGQKRSNVPSFWWSKKFVAFSSKKASCSFVFQEFLEGLGGVWVVTVEAGVEEGSFSDRLLGAIGE